MLLQVKQYPAQIMGTRWETSPNTNLCLDLDGFGFLNILTNLQVRLRGSWSGG